MVSGLQGEEWKFIQKYLKKRSKRVGAQISGSTKDHFAGENEVCEISQMHKKGCEIISQQKANLAVLRSWLSSWGAQLPACRIYRVTSGGISKHCTKRLRNHLATKGWFRNTLQISSFSLEWSTCSGCNFFVLTPNCTPLEALNSWFPEIWNGI